MARVLCVLLFVTGSFAHAADLLYSLQSTHESATSSRQSALQLSDNAYQQTTSRRGVIQIVPRLQHDALSIGQTLNLPRQDAAPLQVTLTGYKALADDRHQWHGHLLDNAESSSVIITTSLRGYYARIDAGERTYVIEPTRDGRHWLIDQTDAGFIHRDMGDDALVAPQVALDTSQFLPRPLSRVAAATTTSTIKLLVLYSDGFAGRHADPQARIDQLVAVTNQALINSKVNAVIEPVHYQTISHPDTDSSNSTLNAMTFSEGVFYSLEDLRIEHEADLVTLVRADHSGADVCGLAWIPDSSQMTSKTHQYGFSLAFIRNPTQDGCPDWVMAHELGHNFGADHDRETGCSGLFKYACGHRSVPFFKTIMAYGPSNTNINVYSSPLIECAGKPCGIASDSANAADNAQMLRVMTPVVAAYSPGDIAVLRPTPDEQLPAGTTFKVTWSNLGVVGRTFDIELLRTNGELVATLNQNLRVDKSLNVVCLGDDCGSWVNQQSSSTGQDDYCSGRDCRALATYSSRVTLPDTVADGNDYVIRVISSVRSTIQARSQKFGIKQNRITIFPQRELAVNEDGQVDSFSIKLERAPSANVRIDMTSSDPGEGVISPAFVVFTANNWFTPQVVKVTGVNDNIVDGDRSFVIVTDPLKTTDTLFAGINPIDIAVVNYDREPDRDGDGVPDGIDTFPDDANESSDFDEDGIGDNADLDDDNDQMPDSYEISVGLNPLDASDRKNDPDSDNLSNWQEFLFGSNPKSADIDTDNDGIPDIGDSARNDAANSGLRRQLTPGKQWSGRYGNGYGNNRYYSTALFTFDNVDDDLVVSLMGFDIDTSSEVSVLLNDEIIDYLPVGPNNSTTGRAYFHISPSVQIDGENELRFTQSRPGHTWGITQIKLTQIETATTQLSFNRKNTVSHGYKIGAAEENILEARYSFTAPYKNRPLLLTLDSFSVDFAGQVEAYLNGNYLGYLLPTSSGQADTSPINASFILPSQWLLDSNIIRFEQSQPGKTWGVNNLTLLPSLNIVAPASSAISRAPKPRISWRLH